MSEDFCMWVAVFGAICGFGWYGMRIFCKTKTDGFGPYNTSTLLMLVVVIISALLLINGALKPDLVANILLTALGFAGGLFAASKSGKSRIEPSTKK